MKFNIYQKVILALYACFFIYFSIIHVPFKKYNNEIKYDTLFSNSSNLEVSRLILIITVLSILTVVLLLLFRNIVLLSNWNGPTKKRNRIIVFCCTGIILIFVGIVVISKYQKGKKDAGFISNVDSTSVTTDSVGSRQEPSVSESKKLETCTTENALDNFKSYMKFYYPDWKIYGKPVVQEQSDCTYQIQFTTIDPHINYKKEVIIVEISFNYDYSRYNFREVRGTLY